MAAPEFGIRRIEMRSVPAGMHRIWPMLVARGALMAIFGILTLVWPALTAVVLISLFGAYAVIDGVMTIGYGIAGKRAGRTSNGWVAQGVIAIVAGLIALFWPAATGAVVLIILGFWALLLGVVLAVIGLGLRRTAPQFWLVPFLLGLVGVIFGLVLIFEPADALIGADRCDRDIHPGRRGAADWRRAAAAADAADLRH